MSSDLISATPVQIEQEISKLERMGDRAGLMAQLKVLRGEVTDPMIFDDPHDISLATVTQYWMQDTSYILPSDVWDRSRVKQFLGAE